LLHHNEHVSPERFLLCVLEPGFVAASGIGSHPYVGGFKKLQLIVNQRDTAAGAGGVYEVISQ
jgi:hypothetical protein